MSTSSSSFKKRQEDAVKKQNGQLAPDLDQDGKMINPHNPDFITKVPWYLGSSGPTLKHHSRQKNDQILSLTETDQLIEEKFKSQTNLRENASKIIYRKGACKNCGAMTHKEKDCIERPRSTKKSAWKTGLDIAADETILNFEDHGKVNYSAKRDNWQGYDPAEYNLVVERFNKMEEERKKKKLQEKEQKRLEDELQQLEKKKEKLERKKLKANTELNKNLSSSSSSSSSSSITKTNNSNNNTASNNNNDDSSVEDSDSDHSDSDSDSDYDSDEEDEDDEDGEVNISKEFIQKDENARDFQGRLARQGGVMGAEMKVTTRNLRIREDTPKYLRNLNLDSAHYDPKSRSMRANPFPQENPEDLPFAGKITVLIKYVFNLVSSITNYLYICHGR